MSNTTQLNYMNLQRKDNVTRDEFIQWKAELPPSPISPDVRLIVRTAYDTMAERIRYGNQLCAHMRSKLGLHASDPEEADKQAKKILNDLRASFDKITDGMKTLLPSREKFKGAGIISNYDEMLLVDNYKQKERDEDRQFRRLEGSLDGIPIWDRFLKQVPGIGVRTAGMLVAYLNPHRAPSPSSFHAFCGVDVTASGQGRRKLKSHTEPRWMLKYDQFSREPSLIRENILTFNPTLKAKIIYLGAESLNKGHVRWPEVTPEEWATLPERVRREKWVGYPEGDKKGKLTREDYDKLPEADRNIIPSKREGGHDKYERRAYQMLVVTSPYVAAKLDYKHRLENSSKPCPTSHLNIDRLKKDPNAPPVTWAETSDGHRDKAANRYMMKLFLTDLWVAWRTLEGLELRLPYAVEYLGQPAHHHRPLYELDGVCSRLGTESTATDDDGDEDEEAA